MSKTSRMMRILEKFLLLPSLIWIYTPIIAGILIAMVHFVPIAFVTWWIFSILGNPNWVLGVFIFRSDFILILLIVLESLIFAIGVLLFSWGLFHLAKTRHNKQGLAKGGPYKWIRHPQHLGLILMTFSIAIYIPWSFDGYIRIGEILSWSLFSMFLTVTSELEEKKLLKHFKEEYLEYRNSTGFYFLRIPFLSRKKKEISDIKHWLRLLLILISFIIFVLFIRLLVYLLQLPEQPGIGWYFDYLSSKYWYVNLILLGLSLVALTIRIVRKRRDTSITKEDCEEQQL